MTTTYANATAPRAVTASHSKLYWKISGPVLLAVAVLGFLLSAIGLGGLLGAFLSFDWAHNAVHLALALLALYLAYAAAPALAKTMALAVGAVYVVLALVGFLSADAFGIGGLLGLHLEIGENLLHAALGAWGLYAGFTD